MNDDYSRMSLPDTGGDSPTIDEPLSEDAPATTSEHDADGWWGIEADTPAAAWKDAHSSHLKNLLRVPSVDSAPESPPWSPGYELEVQGFGGLVSKDLNRYTLVGKDGSFVNQIKRNRDVAADYHSTRVRQSRADSVQGRDRLTVAGDASYTFKSRTLMMSGTVTRNWTGPVMRLASMEGVMCAGAMLRLHTSPSMTMSGMITGDVYGGIARVSAIRLYVALLQYRAAQNAAWALGVWVRATNFTIVPVVSVPPEKSPAGLAAKRMSRLTRVGRKAMKVTRKVVSGARMVCPLVDILLGVITLPFAIFNLAMMFARLVKWLRMRNKIPPVGPPRVENRTSPITAEMYSSKTFT